MYEHARETLRAAAAVAQTQAREMETAAAGRNCPEGLDWAHRAAAQRAKMLDLVEAEQLLEAAAKARGAEGMDGH